MKNQRHSFMKNQIHSSITNKTFFRANFIFSSSSSICEHMGPILREIIFALKTIAGGIPIGLTIVDVFGYVANVEGHSMHPRLNPYSGGKRNADYVFLHSWPIISDSYDKIERGQIVALVSPKNPHQRLIKRVIALQGDLVETRGYYKSHVLIPPGHCWVEGDNTGNSLDSNIFGPVSLGLIKSKAAAIVWPPSRVSWLEKRVQIDRIPNFRRQNNKY